MDASEVKDDLLDSVSRWVKGNSSASEGGTDVDAGIKGLIDDDPFFSHDERSPVRDSHTCKAVLYTPLWSGCGVRLWDVLVLLPCVAFVVFLALRLRHARQKLRDSNSPIFRAFYALVWACALLGTVRCLVSMTVGLGSGPAAEDVADRILWLLLHFSLLLTELSVLVFGVAGAQLDSKRSIKMVVIVASIVALAVSVTETVLEFCHPDPIFYVEHKYVHLFGHGGMAFAFTTSALLSAAYLLVLVLPLLPPSVAALCRLQSCHLPHRASFYRYCALLLLLHGLSAVGALCVVCGVADGLCLVDVVSFAYLTAFVPVVYFTFLTGFFGSSAQPSLLFSYKAQVDDFEDDVPCNGSLRLNTDNGDELDSNTPIVLNGSRLAQAGAVANGNAA